MGDATDSGWERSDAAAHARALIQAAQARGAAEGEQEVLDRCHALGSLSQLLLAPAGNGAVQMCWRELWGGLQILCSDKLLAVAQAAGLACGILAASVSQSLPSPQNKASRESSLQTGSQPPWSLGGLGFAEPPPPTGWGDEILQTAPTGWSNMQTPRNPQTPSNLRGRSSPRGLLKRGAKAATPLDPERTEERRWLAGFFQWVRTLLSDGLQRAPGGKGVNGRSAAALVALHEVFARGSASVLQEEARKMLVAVQALLEDEETPIALLSPLVHLVAALGKNFPGAFAGHQFVDIVDVLLGWALDPTLPEALHYQMSQGTFLQFHASLWGDNYQFAVNLLSKLIGDLGSLTGISDKVKVVSETPRPAELAGAPDKAQSAEDESVLKPAISDAVVRTGRLREDGSWEGMRAGDKKLEELVSGNTEGAESQDMTSLQAALSMSKTSEMEESTGEKQSTAEAGREASAAKGSNEEGTQLLVGESVAKSGDGPGGEPAKQLGVSNAQPADTESEILYRQKEAAPLAIGIEPRERKDHEDPQASVTASAMSEAFDELKLSESAEEGGGVSRTQQIPVGTEEPAAPWSSGESLKPQNPKIQPELAERFAPVSGNEQAKPSSLQTVQLTPNQAGHLLCLLRCFESVLEALASALFLSQRSKTLQPFAKQWLPRILACARLVCAQLQDATWTRECCRCVAVFAELLGEGFAPYYPDAVAYLLETLDHASSNFEAPQVASILQVNLQLLASQKQSLAPPAVATILSSPVVSRLRSHPHQAVVSGVVSTFLYLLQHDTAAVVHAAVSELYQEIRSGIDSLAGGVSGQLAEGGDAERSLLLLKLDVGLLVACSVRDLFLERDAIKRGSTEKSKAGADSESEGRLRLVHEGEVSNKGLVGDSPRSGVPEASLSTAAAANLSSPAPVHNETPAQRVIHILASFFREAEPLPELREALFDALQTICQAASQAGVFEQGLFVIKLCSLALSPGSSFALKLKALKSIEQILPQGNSPRPSTVSNPQQDLKSGVSSVDSDPSIDPTLLTALLGALTDPEADIRERAASILLQSLRSGRLTLNQTKLVAGAAARLSGDVSEAAEETARALLRETGVAMFLITSSASMGTHAGAFDLHQIAIAQQSRTFRPQQLAVLLQHLGQTQHQLEPPLADDWLQRLLHSLGPAPNVDSEPLSPFHLEGGRLPEGEESHSLSRPEASVGRPSISHVAAQHWLVHEAARQCVSSKLRTHFGGPTQTFAAVEQLLKTAVGQLLAGREEGNERGHWRPAPIHFLLKFVDALERQVWGATHGSGILPPVSDEVTTFFAGNKKVVDEWFARLRGLLMQAMSSLQNHLAGAWHASLRLEGLRNATRALASQPDRKGGEVWGRLQKDVSSAVRQLALSLMEAGDPDSIQGLRAWVKQAFPGQLWVNSTHAEAETKAAGGESAPPTAVSNFGWLRVLQLEASGRHEAALDACVRLLNPQSLDGLTPENARFLAERACARYAAVADWQGLQAWLAKVQGLRTANMGAAWTAGLSTAGLDLNPVLALGKFDEGDISGAWSYLDRTPEGNRKVTLSPRLALQRGEQMLLQAMLEAPGAKAEEDLAAARELLDDPLYSAVTVGSLESRGPYLVQAECQRIVESALKPGGKEPVGALPGTLAAILREACEGGKHFDVFRPEWLKLLRAARFALRLGENAAVEIGSSSSLHSSETAALEAFQLQLVRSARRNGNVCLAQRSLEQTPLHLKQTSVPAISELEEALLLHDLSRLREAATLLSRTASLSHTKNKLDTESREGRLESIATARACLKLAEWAQAPRTSAELMARLGREEGQPASRDEVEARALLRAVEVAPQFGKARYRQAAWCDRQAPVEVQLTGEERKVVSELIAGLGNSEADRDSGASGLGGTLVEKVMSSMEGLVERLTSAEPGVADRPRSAERGVKTPGSLNGWSSWALEESLRRKVEGLCLSEGVACGDEQLAEIGRVWRGARARAIGSVAETIKGYSLFLSLSLSSPGASRPVSSVSDTSRGVVRTADQSMEACRADRVLHALVRLLQLLSEHGAVLQKTFSDALRAVPVHTWQALLPQLFALMKAHPQEEVRGLVLETLEALARALPWAVLYPVLAGCREEDVPLEFRSLKKTLMEVAPTAVTDTELMLGGSGLQSLLLLWTEEWLQLLTDLSYDVSKRLNTLHREMQRVSANARLSSADRTRINSTKFAALMTPIAVLIERKLANASAKQGSPYELLFHERYAPKFRAALANLKKPPELLREDDDGQLADVVMLKSACWEPFSVIAHELALELQKHTLPLGDLSPSLAGLRNSHVPLPGNESQTPSVVPSSPPLVSTPNRSLQKVFAPETLNVLNPVPEGVVTIARLEEDVALLSTKTRPKRIGMVGSDGQRYHFLLKGREDMRLDAGIMELLRACNSILQSRRSSRSRSLAVRQYSVTPISARAGLVQWVPGLQSIYSCYKSWQQRQFSAQVKAGLASGADVPPHPPRPSDLYYAKVMAGLKEKGLRRVTSRKEWPQDVKRKALIELMKDTPRQLLAKEVWLASTGAASAFQRQQRYSRTAAVMSMMGHVLGLGDRHLDNILIDFSTADVVHIDHNVAFDKGLRLRVPEVVPFRLTPIMQQALGLTGVEGTFRIACEETLAALRANQSSFLGLLDVFTWEPLAEWTAADGQTEGAALGREERQGMEVAVSLSLLASKLQEQQHSMQEHRNFLVTSVPALYDDVALFLSAQTVFQDSVTAASALQERAQSLAGQGVMIELQLGGAKAAAQNAESALAVSLQQMEALQGVVEAAAKESRQWWEQHEVVVQGLVGSGPAKEQIASVLSAASQSDLPRALTLIGALESTGLGASILPQTLFLTCQNIDARALHLSRARTESLAEGVNALQAYRRALLEMLPADYAQGSAVWKCVQSMEKAVSGLGLADLSGLLEGLAGLTGDRTKAVVQQYRLLKARLGTVEDQLGAWVREVPGEEPVLSKEREAWRQVRAFLGLESASKEESFLGRFGSFSPAQLSRVSVVPEKVQELRAAVYRITLSLGEGLAGLGKRVDVRLVVSQLEVILDKYEALQKVAELATSNPTMPGGMLSDGLSGRIAAYSRILTAVVNGVDAFERELLPDVSSALLARNTDVREALLAIRRLWDDVTGLQLSAEESAERAARVAEMERRLSDMEVRLEGLKSVAQASGGKGGLAVRRFEPEEGHELSQETKSRLSQDSTWTGDSETGVSDISRRWLPSQIAGFEHSQGRGGGTRSYEEVAASDSEGSDAVREAVEAREKLEKEVDALKEELQSERGQAEHDVGSALLEAVRGVRQSFESLIRGGGLRADLGVTLVERIARELEGVVQESASVFQWHNNDSEAGIWAVPESLREEAPFIIQLGLLAGVSEACTLAAGPNVLGAQVETAGLQGLWQGLGGLVSGRVLPALQADFEQHAESLRTEAGATEQLVGLIERYIKAAAEMQSVQRRKRRIQNKVSALESEARETKVRCAQLEWEHETILKRTVSESQWEARPCPLGDTERGLRWWHREWIFSALTRAVNSLTGLQDAANTLGLEARQAEQELDSLVAFVGGDFTTVLWQKITERRQALWQEEQNGLAVNRVCKLVLETEAARSVTAPAGLEGLGLDQTGRVWVEGCARLLTQFHGALSQHMHVAEALQSARAQQSSLLEARSAHFQAVLQHREEGKDLRLTLQASGEELRRLVPKVVANLGGFLEGLEKHSALTRESEGVLNEILAATEGAADESATVKSKAEDVLAVQMELNEQVHQLRAVLNPVQTLLNPLSQTVPALPNPTFDLNPAQPDSGSSLSLWTHLLLTDFLPIITKAEDEVGQLAAEVPENAEEVFEGVLEVAETAAAHAAAALQRAAGGVGDEMHGDALAQNDPPADTTIVEELGEAAAIVRVSEESAPARSPLEPGASPKMTPEKVPTPSSTQREQQIESQAGGKQVRGREKEKSSKRSQAGARDRDGFQRNKHALLVVETVKAKLQGRINAVIPAAPPSLRLLTVTEQVESLLRQATSIDNLASMYEGWTPWI